MKKWIWWTYICYKHEQILWLCQSIFDSSDIEDIYIYVNQIISETKDALKDWQNMEDAIRARNSSIENLEKLNQQLEKENDDLRQTNKDLIEEIEETIIIN